MDAGLAAGASYTYLVVARDASGDSSYPTQELTVTTTAANGLTIYPLADQTITVDNWTTASASFSDTGPIAAHTGTFLYNDTDAQDNAAITESNNQGTATDQHIFSTTGIFPVYVTVQSPTESTVEMYMANVIDATLSSTPAAIQATAGSEFSGMVADAVYMDPVAAYPDTNPADAKYISATINWGDGSAPSTATIIGNGNYDFTINGTHTFATSGTFNTTVTIRDAHGGTTTASGSADVAPALPQAPSSLSASAVSNQEIDLSWSPDPSGNSAGYNIYRSTSPDITPSDDNLIDFGVTGTTYQDTGLDSSAAYYYLVTSANSAAVESSPSNPASATTSAAQLSATGQTITPTEGEEFDGTVASFTDTDVNADASNYTATIAWGDGDTSDATIQLNQTGGFDVTGSHAYKEYGTNAITVTINAADGRSVSASGTANVQDAAIAAEGESIVVYPDPVYLTLDATNVEVAKFSNGNPNAAATDFSASIGWGDGSTSPGTIQSTGDGQFSVLGTNVYASGGDFPLTISIQSSGGASAITQGAAQVNGEYQTFTNGSLSFYSVGNEAGWSDANQYNDYEVGGWGVADQTSGIFGMLNFLGYSTNLLVSSANSTPSGDTSTYSIGSSFEITEDSGATSVAGAPVPNLYELSESIRNISDSTIQLLYRRELRYYESNSSLVSNQDGDPQVAFDDNDGLQSANPLLPEGSGDPYSPTNLHSGTFTAPTDPGDSAAYQYQASGATFQLNFGSLPAGSTQTFDLFYGETSSIDAAHAELAAAGINTWSTMEWGSPSAPIIFIFGFKPGPQISADMQVDSNNDGTINSTDDQIQDDPTLPGKVIVANTLDENGSKEPGYADFNTSAALYDMPLTMALANFDPNKAKVRFDYSAADPSLVKSTNVSGSDIPKYDPGSTGYLRLWSGNTGRDPKSVASGGNYIPPNTPISVSDIDSFTSPDHIYVEGVNPTDPNSTEVKIEVDPTGTGDWAILDAARFTVGSVQLVYTDVSGLSHNSDDPNAILGVPRIATNLQPEGAAADWKNGVDDGSMLLIRVVASPAVAALTNNALAPLGVSWGGGMNGTTEMTSLDPNNGQLQALDSGLVTNAASKLQSLGIEGVGQQWGTTGLTVLGAEFYHPPTEFDGSQGTADTATYRRVEVAVQLSTPKGTLASGGKPEEMMLTRPPLVAVHGINSNPKVWFDASGGTSFYAAVTAAGYPRIFLVDHTGVDPSNPSAGRMYGEGEISDMYQLVEQTVGQATATYRAGIYFPVDPYFTPPTGQPGAAGALIADQKVDVVAHSYGGLLTRWYIEQSSDYANRRDVRNLMELDTPNLGSPLANMVAEALTTSDTLGLGNLIDDANAYGIGPVAPKIRWLLSFLNVPGKLVNAMGNGTAYPFFLDAGVDSARLAQLNGNPFNNDVGYASTIGTHNTIPITNLPVIGSPNVLDPFKAFQPMDNMSAALVETGSGYSYFPWLYQFDSAVGATDGIVPVWSQQLGVTAYSPTFDVNHIQVVQNSAIQQQVIAWLADPNVPLGSTQRAAWDNQPPPSEANAYQPTQITSSGASAGGGLNPQAIIGVNLPGTGFRQATFGSDPNSAGVYLPTISGMVSLAAINAGGNVEVNLTAGNQGAPAAWPTITKAIVPISSLVVDPAQIARSKSTDYVAFTLQSSSLVFGRTHQSQLTGPAASSPLEPGGIWYSINAFGLTSGATPVSVPAFQLPAPGIVNGSTVTVSGAVEYGGPGTAATVHLYAASVSGPSDIDLGQFSPVTVSLPTYPANSAGVNFWNGVLGTYSAQMILWRDPSGNVEDAINNTGQQHPSIYQLLLQPQGTPNDHSSAIVL